MDDVPKGMRQKRTARYYQAHEAPSGARWPVLGPTEMFLPIQPGQRITNPRRDLRRSFPPMTGRQWVRLRRSLNQRIARGLEITCGEYKRRINRGEDPRNPTPE